MLTQEIRTVQIIRLGDLYYGRTITDNASEMLKIIRTFHNPEINNTIKRRKDANGNVCEEHQFITRFKRVYEHGGNVFIDFEVWSEIEIPEDWISIGQLIQHYNPTYQWVY